MGESAPINVLIVEDNPGDVELAKEALRETSLELQLQTAANGEEALELLRNEDAKRRTDLVLLDLNMPKKSGHEVLAEMKADETLRLIPVVVFTSSSSSDDIEAAYDRHANCYITKPGDLDELVDVVRAIEAFWLTVVRLPRRAVA